MAKRIQINGLGRFRKKIIRLSQRILSDEKSQNKTLSLTFTDDDELRNLNRRYRKVNRSTDVLSFSMQEDGILGDVIISVESAERNANRFKQRFEDEILRLVVHGILHLLGYDHKKVKDRTLMRQKEEEYLCREN